MPEGPHYSLIKRNVPDWLGGTTWPRAQTLGLVSLGPLPKLLRTYDKDHAPLKAANGRAWTTQNSVDKRLEKLQDLYAFATPLLSRALLDRYELDLDVRATYLFLVIAKGALLKGSTSRTLSLLDAALQNFASGETFTDSSSYITLPDARGHFMIEAHKEHMSIAQFVALCRELDLGAQYAQHLQQHLLVSPGLQAEVIASQQAALDNAAHLALLQGDIQPATFHLLQRAVKGERGVMQFYRLRLQDTLLTGILMIATDLDLAKDTAPVVVYIPHDPNGAIQHFPNTLAFRTALLERLKAPTYREFFSQFVDHAQRATFFSSVLQRATFAAVRIDGDLWPQLYQAALNKILNDGRALAVPTADADRRARWAWWNSLSQTLESALNVALLIITPFVPLLGEAMLAYTAYQLLDEMVEGTVDLAEGHALEAAGHFVGVVSDVVQLAAFGVGGQLAQSTFVNGLHAVEVNGKTRLWHPDPRPYQQTLQLSAESTADALGLHTHAGQTILPWDGAHYAVKFDAASGDHRVQHATRPDAYAPPIRHNDGPRAWSNQRRLQALGPFDAAQQEQILHTSALDHGALRAVQADNQPAPLLDDTLKRLRLHLQAAELPDKMRAGESVDHDTYWSPHVARELPGWPEDHAILVYEAADLSGDYLRFGEPEAPHTLAISRDALNLGKLPERLVDFLDAPQLTTLLGTLPDGRPAQIDALRNRLADQLAQRRGSMFAYLYRNSEDVISEHGLRVRETCPGLPKSMVRHVLAQARPDELAIMDSEKRLPLRLKTIARELHLQANGAHAYQGFYDAQLFGPQTEQMVLDTLRLFSDSLADSRIEIRQHSPIATLRASAGPQAASHRRLLLKIDERYEVYDGDQQRLQPAAEFFDATLHALPSNKRRAFANGQALKRWVMDTLLTPESRRSVLADPATKPRQQTQHGLQKPMHAVPAWSNLLFPGTLKQRVKVLYPYADQEVITTYLASLEDPLQLRQFEDREIEKSELRHDLSNWINAIPADEPEGPRHQRTYLAKALLRTWEENLDADETGVRLSLQSVRLAGLLGNLRLRANFDHVLHLELIDAQLLDSDIAFLDSFPRLLSLSLRDNQLSQLPTAVTRMTSLTHLSLENNPIQWNTENLGQVAGLTQLRQISLAYNRHLAHAPNVARLPHLEAMSLRNTAISEWPEGLFDRSRPWGFYLDVQNTDITSLPQFLPWQPEAELLARARLDRNHLSAEAEQRLVSYRLEVGLDPYRSYPPKGDAGFWLEREDALHLSWLQTLWDEVEAEHGSQGFFEVIKSLEPSAFFEDEQDETLYEQGRGDLTDKVWRMLLAMEADSELRGRLFQMASNPVTCADAGAHIFNAMGLEVQLVEIDRDVHDAFRELKLAYLARGKSRLDHLNRAAQADIRQRIKPREEGGQGLRFSTDVIDGVPGTVDEVEVYLAYHTGLKSRLKLPWVTPYMHYRSTADVNPTRLDSAFDNVMRTEANDGLVDGMLAQPFWDRHLRTLHASRFLASLDRANELIDPLDDLLFAQSQWASADAEERDTLKPRLLSLANALNVPHADVLTGQPMSTQTYESILAGGFSENVPSEQDLARQLTQEVLQRLNEYENNNAE